MHRVAVEKREPCEPESIFEDIVAFVRQDGLRCGRALDLAAVHLQDIQLKGDRRRGIAVAARDPIRIAPSWEVLENSDWIINRYRAATIALGYYGDSAFNSVGDIASCMVGFALAAYLPTRITVALVILIEVTLTLWIRDGLMLNILMLTYPIGAVRSWQLGH